jgi:uncharacterized protein
MKGIFMNKHGQMRSGWKIGLVLVMTLFAIFVINYFIDTLAILTLFSSLKFKSLGIEEDKALQSILNSPVRTYMLKIGSNLAMISAVYGGIKLLDRKKLRDTGFIISLKSIRELAIGLILGAISISAVFFILLKSQNIKLLGNSSNSSLSSSVLWGLAVFIFVGISEELFSRGYCMMVLKQVKAKWFSPVVSSVIFAILHIVNPNLRVIGLFNILLLGLLFAYMAIKTKNIMMPIGYHITWNFLQGNIYGLSVSGTATESIYKIEVLSDNLLTGGAFGPEAGLLTTVVVILGAGVVWGYSYLLSGRSQKMIDPAASEIAAQ